MLYYDTILHSSYNTTESHRHTDLASSYGGSSIGSDSGTEGESDEEQSDQVQP